MSAIELPQSRLHSFHRILVCVFFLRIYVDLAVFQPYLDLEAGDNQSLKILFHRKRIDKSRDPKNKTFITEAKSWYIVQAVK